MSHFSAIEWVDFARRLMPPEKANLMQASAETCEECRSSSAFWGHVYELLSPEGDCGPSMSVLQSVRNAFPKEQPIARWSKDTDLMTLVFDSFKQPAVAGVRPSATSSRSSQQIMVEAGPFVIDLRVESDTVQQRYRLNGQIRGKGDLTPNINGANVVLLSPEKVVQKTRTNVFGEFCLDCDRGENLRLFIDMKGERGVAIILPRLEVIFF